MTKEEILSQYYGNVYEEPEEFIEIIKAMEQYRNEGLREFAREMQNIGVMDDRLPSNEYVFIWLDSIKEE